jgi:hypothetical protein
MSHVFTHKLFILISQDFLQSPIREAAMVG